MARILVVEDDPRIRRLLEFRLRNLGHEGIFAEDGGKAVQTAIEERPDIILLDVMLPVMNGFQVLQKLKFQKETMDIPVIMLTAKVQEEDVVYGLETGAVDYVTKPFSFAELNARINHTLKSH
ncbi:response regulator transcription factor [Chloroflexota bacterium]